jgi:hypothetical protein
VTIHFREQWTESEAVGAVPRLLTHGSPGSECPRSAPLLPFFLVCAQALVPSFCCFIRSFSIACNKRDPPSQERRPMSELVTKGQALIIAAGAAIGPSRKEPPSACSTLLARLIVNEAKKLRPDDTAIQRINLEGNILDWHEISAAMNVIVKALG